MRISPVAALLAAALVASAARAGTVHHSAAECRAACRDRNMPASCAWLTPVPARCLRAALTACERSAVPGPAQCPPPADLPVCGTNQDCAYGALCIDSTCQVLGCGAHGGFADCTGTHRCQGDKCVVADCGAATANCAKGLHCEPASPPFSSISGTCAPDVPGVTYCAGSADCIAPGNFNPTCVAGVCTRQRRAFGRCATDDDCAARCRRGRASAHPGRCDAAGLCVCTSCGDDAECGPLLACPQGRNPTCAPSGACVCRKRTEPASTSTTTITTTTLTTDTTATTTTTVPADTTCCCNFEQDQMWHCVHASEPSPWLCYVPWPDCCAQPYTVCQ